METRDTGTQHKLRMPPELKEKLFISAKEMNRSLNAEIVARLEASFESKAIPVTELPFNVALGVFREQMEKAGLKFVIYDPKSLELDDKGNITFELKNN